MIPADVEMAEHFFDEEIAHKLGAGIPADGLSSIRRRYIEDVQANPVAMQQLTEWWTGTHGGAA